MQGVYEIYCSKSGKRYIGSSKDIEKRWESHLRGLRSGKHHNYYLQKAYYRYGEDNFVFSILKIVDDENDLYKVEEQFIKKFKFNKLFNAMRKPGAVPKKQSRWMQYCAGETSRKEKKKEEWAFGGE
jgi:group I intron endonuclease